MNQRSSRKYNRGAEMNAEQIRINELLEQLADAKATEQHRLGQIQRLDERVRELEKENQRLKDIIYKNH